MMQERLFCHTQTALFQPLYPYKHTYCQIVSPFCERVLPYIGGDYVFFLTVKAALQETQRAFEQHRLQTAQQKQEEVKASKAAAQKAATTTASEASTNQFPAGSLGAGGRNFPPGSLGNPA